MKKKLSQDDLEQLARDWHESIVNGNWNYVAEELNNLSTMQAIFVFSYMPLSEEDEMRLGRVCLSRDDK